MKFHKDGTLPLGDEVLVFGSNMAGRHGMGAALVARQRFGALPHVWAGREGQSYAIPTKGPELQVLQLPVIASYVYAFLTHARRCHDDEFWVTRIGCGLAGYDDADIAPMFIGAPANCSFAEEWKRFLESGEGVKP